MFSGKSIVASPTWIETMAVLLDTGAGGFNSTNAGDESTDSNAAFQILFSQ